MIVGFFNAIIFLFLLLAFGILNLAGGVINIALEWFNGLSIHIPVIDVDINLPNIPLIPSIGFPPFVSIPWKTVDDVRIFNAGSILIIEILEWLGISFPF